MKKVAYIFLVLVFLFGCANDKQELIDEYHKIYPVIKDKKFKEIYQILDKQSQEYLKFLTDTTNWQINKIRNYGRERNVEYTTLFLYNILKSVSNSQDFGKLLVLEIMGVSEIPLFNWFKEPRLMEEKTKKENDNNVYIAYDLNEKIYYSVKVNLKKNQDGQYKLNIFPLFEMKEKAYKYQFKKYKRTHYNLPDDISDEKLVEQFFKELIGD